MKEMQLDARVPSFALTAELASEPGDSFEVLPFDGKKTNAGALIRTTEETEEEENVTRLWLLSRSAHRKHSREILLTSGLTGSPELEAGIEAVRNMTIEERFEQAMHVLENGYNRKKHAHLERQNESRCDKYAAADRRASTQHERHANARYNRRAIAAGLRGASEDAQCNGEDEDEISPAEQTTEPMSAAAETGHDPIQWTVSLS